VLGQVGKGIPSERISEMGRACWRSVGLTRRRGAFATFAFTCRDEDGCRSGLTDLPSLDGMDGKKPCYVGVRLWNMSGRRVGRTIQRGILV